MRFTAKEMPCRGFLELNLAASLLWLSRSWLLNPGNCIYSSYVPAREGEGGEIIEVYFICWRINLYIWREAYGISLCPSSIYAYISVSEINLPLFYTQNPAEWDGQYLTSLCWITIEQYKSSVDHYKIVHSILGNVLTWFSTGTSAMTPEHRWWSNYSYLRDSDDLQSQCFAMYDNLMKLSL